MFGHNRLYGILHLVADTVTKWNMDQSVSKIRLVKCGRFRGKPLMYNIIIAPISFLNFEGDI